MSNLRWVNLALRAVMETSIVVAFAYWGFETGTSYPIKILLGIVAPVVGFGIWGTLDFRQAGSLAEPLRLLEELVISGLAAAAVYATGHHTLGISLAALSLVYHLLVYVSGERLLKPKPQSADPLPKEG